MIRGQRVRRVVRSIDTWSVVRVAVLFYLSLMLVMVLAGVMLWAAGSLFGAVDSVESFMRGIGFEGFEFVGGQLLRGFTAIGLILVVLGTGSTVLAALLYNLIADVVGGVQLTVLEEVYVPDEERLPIAVDRTGEEWAVAAAAPVEVAPEPASQAEPAADPEPATVQEPEPGTIQEPEPRTIEEPEPANVVEPEPTPVQQPEPQAVHQSEHPRTEPLPVDQRDDEGDPDGTGSNGWTTPAWQPANRSQ